MLAPLIAYDADGNVVATLDFMVARDADGRVIGLIDFEAWERSGRKLREVWEVGNAVGSGTWPEWLGTRAHDFRVERGPDGRIAALVPKNGGPKRVKRVIQQAITRRVASAGDGGTVDISDLVGGPGRPLRIRSSSGGGHEHDPRS
jgi:hypothetical protein